MVKEKNYTEEKHQFKEPCDDTDCKTNVRKGFENWNRNSINLCVRPTAVSINLL